jgi:hypothetical protein
MMRRLATVRTNLWLMAAVVLGIRAAGCASSEDDPSARANPNEEDAATLPPLPAVDGSSPTDDAQSDTNTPSNERCSADGWCRVDMPDDKVSLAGIWGSSKNDVWAVGSNGAVFHWNGASWTAQRNRTDAGQPRPLFGIWGSGPNDVWAYSANELLHTDGWNDSETVWSTFEVIRKVDRLEGSIRGLWGSSATDVWMLVGSTPGGIGLQSGKCWRSAGWDGGTPQMIAALDHYKTSTAGTNFVGMWGSGPRDIWIVGESGRILHTDGYWGGMAEWTLTNSNTRSHLNAVWGTASDNVWAVGEDGTIRHWTYNEGGELQWGLSASMTTSVLRAIWGSSATDVWVVGNDSTILHGNGATWTRSQAPSLPPATPLYGIWGSGPDDVWIVGQRVILHRDGKTPNGGVQ